MADTSENVTVTINHMNVTISGSAANVAKQVDEIVARILFIDKNGVLVRRDEGPGASD